MTRNLALSLSLIAFFGCTVAELTPEEKLVREKAKDVGIIAAISALEITEFRETGPVSCNIHWSNLGDKPEELCRERLKIEAAEQGATIVVVENRETFKCTSGSTALDCVRMSGHAYVKRSKTMP